MEKIIIMLFVLSFYSLECKSQDICQKEFYGASANVKKIQTSQTSKPNFIVKVFNICTVDVRIIIQIFNSETNNWFSPASYKVKPGGSCTGSEYTWSTIYRWAVVKPEQSSNDVTDWHNE